MVDREVPPFNGPNIFYSPKPMNPSSFLVPPTFHKSWNKISLKGEGCNTPHYEILNYFY
jgi:hypothetical protein